MLKRSRLIVMTVTAALPAKCWTDSICIWLTAGEVFVLFLWMIAMGAQCWLGKKGWIKLVWISSGGDKASHSKRRGNSLWDLGTAWCVQGSLGIPQCLGEVTRQQSGGERWEMGAYYHQILIPPIFLDTLLLSGETHKEDTSVLEQCWAKACWSFLATQGYFTTSPLPSSHAALISFCTIYIYSSILLHIQGREALIDAR